MNGWHTPASHVALAAGLVAVAVGAIALSCAPPPRTPSEPRLPRDIELPAYMKDTVSEVAAVVGRDDIPVQCVGFVANLDGTGTRSVPPGIRAAILEVMRRNKVEGAEELLSNPDNAVVLVTGLIPMGINKGEHFDLDVRAVPNTDTTSLEGGFVLECDLTRVLSARGVEAKSEILALGRGGIFVSPFGTDKDGKKTGDPRVGRVLGGGKALKTRSFQLSLYNPSARTADQLVRTVNTRFIGAAKGNRDPGRVDLQVPKEYQNDKAHFLDLVGGLYMREGGSVRDQRVEELVALVRSGEDVDRVALCVESFGPSVAPRLHTLCDDPSEAVRFYVGRTLAGIQDGRAVSVLDPIVMNDKSEFQEAAVEALGKLRSGAGLGVLSRALNTKSARVRVAAWQAMLEVAPQSTVVRRFEDKFSLSVVPSRGDPFIYVARTLRPHIAIFGGAKIQAPVLAETARVTASVVAGSDKVRLITRRGGVDVHIDATLDLRDIIEKMATPSWPKPDPDAAFAVPTGPPQGLDLGYSDAVGLIYELSQKRALTVPLMLQPLKYYIPGDRPVARPIETAPKGSN